MSTQSGTTKKERDAQEEILVRAIEGGHFEDLEEAFWRADVGGVEELAASSAMIERSVALGIDRALCGGFSSRKPKTKIEWAVDKALAGRWQLFGPGGRK